MSFYPAKEKGPMLTLILASVLFTITMLLGILGNAKVQAALFDADGEILSVNLLSETTRVEARHLTQNKVLKLKENAFVGKKGDWSWCQVEPDANPSYEIKLLSVSVPEYIESGSDFHVTMTFQNSGSPVYSSVSDCVDKPIFKVVTQKHLDRSSLFGTSEHAISGWESASRLAMNEKVAKTGEKFHVVFQSKAPIGDNLYREFFQGLVEGVEGLGLIDEMFAFDLAIGTPSETMKDNMQYVSELAIDAAQLENLPKNLEVDLSDQTLYAKFGDIAVWKMRISSGAYDTPTPPGDYKVFQKQELRRGGEAPHYMMPWWMFWDKRGYGIHGLPYLANDNGRFWTEAVSHIGTPVSHGCIRIPSEDAETLYKFTPIGTPLKVHR